MKSIVHTAASVLLSGIVFYLLSDPSSETSPTQWALLAGLLIGTLSLYSFIVKGTFKNKTLTSLAVFLFFVIATAIVFYPTLGNIFRQDDWLIMLLFSQATFSAQFLKDISLFEMFGHMRFQPLAHLLMFIRYLAFGNNIIAYHILSILLHAFSGFLIFFILSRLLKDPGLSFISGLLFLTFPSHFETVAWTYHIYIMIGTQLVLLSIYLTDEYIETNRVLLLAAAVFSAFISVLLYEPAILVPAAILVILAAFYVDRNQSVPAKRLFLASGFIFLSYLAYIAITIYGITLANHRMSAGLLLSVELFSNGIIATLTDVWMILLKNIGVAPSLHISDLVYVHVQADLLGDVRNIIKLALAAFIVLSFRAPRAGRSIFVISSIIMVLSYVFIIALGRVLTNDIEYVTTQSRYQYFPNAMLILSFVVLISRKCAEKGWRKFFIGILLGFFFWNSQNSLSANNQVSRAMAPLDIHYYRLKEFCDLAPDARVFLDFTPETDNFTLGRDIAMDVLLDKNSTKFLGRATHIYDGNTFRKADRAAYFRNNGFLGDFSVSWDLYRLISHSVHKDLVIVGSDKIYPRISLTTDDHVKVELKNALTGGIETWNLWLPELPQLQDNEEDRPVHLKIQVIKRGNELILRLNDADYAAVRLPSTYRNWDGDGAELFGGFYRGSGDYVNISNLRIYADAADL